MENEKKIRNHKVLDHPILGYLLLVLWGTIFTGLNVIIDYPLALVIPGYGTQIEMMGITTLTAAGIGTAFAALLMLFVHKKWFAPNYKGMLSKDNLVKGLILLAPFVICHGIGSIVSWCAVGAGGVGIAVLRAFAPGFGEEAIFRGLGVSNFMRTIKNEKQIPIILWMSAIVFGFAHTTNALAGAELGTSLLQSAYALGVGILFGAIFLRTGSLWPTIIAHYLVDFLEFCRTDISQSGGVMGALTVGDIITLVVGFAALFWGLYLCRKSTWSDIMTVWADKWNKHEKLS